MRIGVDIRELAEGSKTGIGRLLLNFLEFAAHNDTENEYLLFANQNTSLPDLPSRIKTRVIPEFSRIIWDQIVLPDQIKREKVDIFYSPYYKGPLFSQAKLIVTCNDLYFLEKGNNPISAWMRRNYCRLIFKKADRIIAISQYSKKEALRLFGFPEGKVEIVYATLDKRFRPLDKTESFNKLNKKFVNLKKDFVLYVGNFNPHKNVSRIIEAYNLLPGPLKDKYQLVIVGKKEGGYYPLAKLVKNYGLEDKVVFLELVSEDELVYLYNATTALILVSLWEGFGLPALEAMACGAPVVVSNTTAFPEVVGNAGLYVNPYNIEDILDKLKLLLENEDLRSDLSQKGLIQSGKFKCEYSANAILGIFKELIHSATPTLCRGRS